MDSKKSSLIILKTVVVLVCITGGICKGQEAGRLGLGLRLGNVNSGVSVQYMLTDSTSLEAIAFISNTGNSGAEFAFLWQRHWSLMEEEKNFRLFGGVGGHVGFWNQGYARTVMGPDAMLGLSYFLDGPPFSFSFDWHPFVNVVDKFETWFNRGGLTVRYFFQ